MPHEPSLSMAHIDSIDRSALGNQACARVSLFFHLACIVPDHLQWHLIPPLMSILLLALVLLPLPQVIQVSVCLCLLLLTPPSMHCSRPAPWHPALLALNRNEHPIHTRDCVCSQCSVRKHIYRFLGKR